MTFLDFLTRLSGTPVNANMRSVEAGVLAARTSGLAQLDTPIRMAHYTAQLTHESGRFKYDREVWGPTPAQSRYEDRADLGHSPAVDGEAWAYRGKGPIQITGRANHAEFRDWCRDVIDPAAPDFEEDPMAILRDPWEGLGPIWYWSTRNLNRYADRGDIEMVTKRINGGLNGYADRLRLFDRAALLLLNRQPSDIRGFQSAAGILVDGISGPQTRAALHRALEETTLPFWEGETLPGVLPDPPSLAGDTTLYAAVLLAESHIQAALNALKPVKEKVK